MSKYINSGLTIMIVIVEMQTSQIAKRVHKLGDSYAVVIHPSLVKQLSLDAPLTFLSQEVQDDGSIVMRPKRLS